MLFGSQVKLAGEGIKEAAEGGASFIGAISELFTSSDNQQRMEMIKNQPELLKLLIDESKDAMAMHAQFAKHTSVFVAGGRPALMWVCAVMLLLAGFFLAVIGFAEGFGLLNQAVNQAVNQTIIQDIARAVAEAIGETLDEEISDEVNQAATRAAAEVVAKKGDIINMTQTLEDLIKMFAYLGASLAGIRGGEKAANHFGKNPSRGVV